MDVPDRALVDGAVIRAPRRFDLVGVRGAGLEAGGFEVRVRRAGGRWSGWVPIGAGTDHAPDKPLHAPASDPVWAGGADELQLRGPSGTGALSLVFVAVPETPASVHAQLRQVQANAPIAGAPPVIVTRAQWGASQVRTRAAPTFGAVELAFVHHTVNANDYTPADSARIVLGIAKYHVDHNGWNDIGYNFLVDKYGQVFEGRAGGIDQPVVGAQAGGWNSKSTGVANIGSYQSVALNSSAEDVVARLIAWKLALHGAPLRGTVQLTSGGGAENRYAYGTKVTLNRVSGHRDGCKTDCPGDGLYGQLDDLRTRVAALAGTFSTRPSLTLVTPTAAITYGRQAAFSGRLTAADGSPIGGVAIAVQKHGSAGAWTTIAKASSGSDGRWAATVPWYEGAVLRAAATLPDSTTARSAQATVSVLATLELTMPGANSRVRAGTSATLSGRVAPSGKVSIRLQRQVAGGRWVPAGTVAATVKGHAFSARIPLRRAALYRLTARGGTPAHPVVSPAIHIRAVKSASSTAKPKTIGAGPPAGATGPGGAAAT